MTVEDAKVLQEKLAVLAKVSGARLELLTTTLYIRGPVRPTLCRSAAAAPVHCVRTCDMCSPRGAVQHFSL